MPAAAVIPAPIAYIKVVAVKKLVVEFRACETSGRVLVRSCTLICFAPYLLGRAILRAFKLVVCRWDPGSFTVRKLECSKRAIDL